METDLESSADSFRELLPYERMVLDKILSQDFVGSEYLKRQVATARVTTVDDEGSFTFADSTARPAPFKMTVPLEAMYTDLDGGIIHYSLMITKAGQLREMDVYREDGEKVLSVPPDSDCVRLY